MADTPIRFDDGAGYERYMGRWSQLAGEVFLDWLAAPSGLRWLDIGCGNGAFTSMLAERTAPAALQGLDPSAEQLAFAGTREGLSDARFCQGDAMALPFPAAAFDAAVMPLVIFFVPEPARGVAEMARVVCPGGMVSAYAWDMPGGGFPYHALQSEIRALGYTLSKPPSPEASRIEELHALWTAAGLAAVKTCAITVERSFASFDDYWATVQLGPSVAPLLSAMAAEERALLQARMRARLPADADGRILCSARAHAVRGRVPAVGVSA